VQRVVIIGGGQAGAHGAMHLRARGFKGEIHLVHAEPGLPYQRPPLSKTFLLDESPPESLDFRPAGFYEKERITLHPTKAVAIDRARGEVRLGDGTALAYDALILALGAAPRLLPGAPSSLLMLRTREDALRLRPRIAASREVLIVGGGFIGCELAAALAGAGRKVRLIEAQDEVMQGRVSPLTARLLREALEAEGVEVLRAARIAAWDEDGLGVRLADGRALRADLLLAATGVAPETALAAEAGLAVSPAGIEAGADFRTLDPAIFAVGDCVFAHNLFAGGPVRLESVQHATDSARHVAELLLGASAPYRKVPWFWSDQGKRRLQIAGLIAGCDAFRVEGDPGAMSFSVYGYRGEELRCVESVNRPADHIRARKALAEALDAAA
jgi:3-phenylpropionate/trans-cinnamate dioxygenase ferredoxin reductase subunit